MIALLTYFPRLDSSALVNSAHPVRVCGTKIMRFLLLDGGEESYWTTFLADALAPLGTLSVARAGQEASLEGDEPDGLILIDATMVENVEKMVLSLRLERPSRRIVVMTASPTWQRARAAFEAGAIDYLPKTLSRDELRGAFEQILDRPLPPWPEIT